MDLEVLHLALEETKDLEEIKVTKVLEEIKVTKDLEETKATKVLEEIKAVTDKTSQHKNSK
jgi:hypothetical protein